MSEVPAIVLPHGGYKKLIVYRKSDVIYQGGDVCEGRCDCGEEEATA